MVLSSRYHLGREHRARAQRGLSRGPPVVDRHARLGRTEPDGELREHWESHG